MKRKFNWDYIKYGFRGYDGPWEKLGFIPDYVTSDTHFGHKNIIKYCSRPFKDTHEMTETLVENWNKVVQPHHKVLHLGDHDYLGVKNSYKITSRLNGEKYLVMGNHDDSVGKMLRKGFKEVYDSYVYIDLGEFKISASHYPNHPGKLAWLRATLKRYAKGHWEKFPEKSSLWHLYGHVHNNHGRVNYESKCINVSCDVWDYTPIYFPELLSTVVRNRSFR